MISIVKYAESLPTVQRVNEYPREKGVRVRFANAYELSIIPLPGDRYEGAIFKGRKIEYDLHSSLLAPYLFNDVLVFKDTSEVINAIDKVADL